MANPQENKQQKRLNIGLFIDIFFPMVDGIVMVVDNYARRLAKDHNVTVFTIKPRKPYDDSKLPYKVVRCPMLPMHMMDYDCPLPGLSREFKKAIENSKLDIVHIHSPFGVGKTGMMYAKKHNLPVVATMHGKYYKDFLRETHGIKWLAKLLLKKVIKVFNSCDECWAVNKNVAEIYYQEYGAKEMPIVHSNGTDFLHIDNLDKAALKKEYHIADDEKVFLFVGRLTYLKNIDFIVRSLKNLKDKGFKFKMLFVGSGPDECKLNYLIQDLDLSREIKLLGKITDRVRLAKIYNMADLFLFPSLYDCSSLVQIEAASQKTPTVFIAGPATAYAVEDNINGYLAENDETKYAEKICEIFSNEKAYNKVCQKAYEDLFVSWDSAVEKAYNAYLEHIAYKNNEK